MKTLVQKYAFDTTSKPPVYCEQSFVETDGSLFHVIDGTLRAIVPGQFVPDYLDSPNINQALTAAEIVAIQNVFVDNFDGVAQMLELAQVAPVEIGVTNTVEIL